MLSSLSCISPQCIASGYTKNMVHINNTNCAGLTTAQIASNLAPACLMCKLFLQLALPVFRACPRLGRGPTNTGLWRDGARDSSSAEVQGLADGANIKSEDPTLLLSLLVAPSRHKPELVACTWSPLTLDICLYLLYSLLDPWDTSNPVP